MWVRGGKTQRNFHLDSDGKGHSVKPEKKGYLKLGDSYVKQWVGWGGRKRRDKLLRRLAEQHLHISG